MASDEEGRPLAPSSVDVAGEGLGEVVVEGAGEHEGEAVGVTSLGIWSLAWPTMLSMGTFTIVRMTDFAMVGDLGPEALAAVGVGGNFYWLVESFITVSSGGLTALFARAWGAGDRALAERSFQQAQVQGVLLSILGAALVFPFTHAAIRIYGVEEGVVALGADYVWWRLWGTIPLSLAMIFGTAVRAAGDTRTPLWVSVVGATTNVFLNWVLIYGNLGAPKLGVAGAAIATNAALVVMTLHFGVLWAARMLVVKPGRDGWWPEADLQRRLFRLGLPVAAEGGFFQLGLMAFQRVIAGFGTNAIAAYNVGSMLLSVSFMPGVAFSLAASTLVGQYLGAQDAVRAEREGWRSMWIAIGSMALCGLLLAAFARPIADVFTDDGDVIELTILILTILGVAHPFMAVEFALGGALRGAGDTLFPMFSVFAGLIVVRLGLATALVTFFDAPLEWVWSVLIADYVLKTMLLVGRFRGGSWKTRQV